MGSYGSKGQGARAERKQAEAQMYYMGGYKKGLRDGWLRGAVIAAVVSAIVWGGAWLWSPL